MYEPIYTIKGYGYYKQNNNYYLYLLLICHHSDTSGWADLEYNYLIEESRKTGTTSIYFVAGRLCYLYLVYLLENFNITIQLQAPSTNSTTSNQQYEASQIDA